MANFRAVNRAIRDNYPQLNIEVVRGEGYVYFDGNDGFAKVESIMVNPTTTATEDLIRICKHEISRSVLL